MSVTEVSLEKDQLVKLLKFSLGWTESILKSFTPENLKKIYSMRVAGESIYKARVTQTKLRGIAMHFPKGIVEESGFGYGDRFDYKIKPISKEIHMVFCEGGRNKFVGNKTLNLPYKLVENGMIKPKDDIMLYLEDDRIIMKSFSFLQ